MYKWVISLMLCSMFSSACTHKGGNSQNDASELTMIVGTYTSPDGSKGIYSYRFNEETGEYVLLDSIAVNNPSYLTLSKDNRFVYAVSELKGDESAVHAFAFDKKSGALKHLNSQPTIGGGPCYVATDGKRVVTANYYGGSVSTFPLRYDGSLDSISGIYEGEATGPHPKRQVKPHVHCVQFTPDSNYLLATDFSSDRILKYAVNSKEDKLFPLADTIQVEPSSGPRHLTFSPDGKYVYVIGELSGKVTAFSYADGRLNPIQSITADTLHAEGSADIHLSPDGKYLYATNRLQSDGVAIFEVNPDNGTLATVGYQSTGIHPRNFNITPNGKFLLVACRDSNVIQIFRRDSITGLLEPTGEEIALSKPVCIQFAQ